ncbi:hypothetical protein [Burkholderia multivorans]|uniref:hypothetical protein n=1 Tax=Burkholderia multivorans TaxID=87883 RepID=UPI0021BE0FF5|nr:hypothetical protein [Burkholderia multivorans]MDR8763325.1 hypothetical protein [Burkholderia multivorans]MDR8768990.1 hypothetical protein [Burkholderia multivorans]MDR8774904.1 hypothetical protein [Burkholderia multivorans]MDR8792516.1 hypothetical protein [Burkholderia multivorans]MDR8798625.1 hypothetical protein [Burkholderia multivorans]
MQTLHHGFCPRHCASCGRPLSTNQLVVRIKDASLAYVIGVTVLTCVASQAGY